MADLPISSAASLTHFTIAVGDLFPLIDISADIGSKGSKITLTELAASIFTVGATVATVFSVNGAASTPALTFSGSIMSGGSGATNLPHILFQPSGITTYTGYNTSGTVIGFNLSGSFGGYVLDYINGGNRAVYIDSNGFGVRDMSSANSTYFWYDGVRLNDTAKILWYPSSISGSADSGIVRGGVGLVKVTDGSSGLGSIQALSLTTSAPISGISAPWKLGQVTAGIGTIATNEFLEVDISGVLRKIVLYTS